MSGEPDGLSLDLAVSAALKAMGKPGLLHGDPAPLPERLAPLGLTLREIALRPGLPDHLACAALLIELGEERWVALLPRPGAVFDQVDDDGNLSPLPAELAHSGRAMVLEVAPPPAFALEVKSFLRRHRRHLLPVMAGGVVTNLLALALPLFGSFIYDKVLGNGVSETLWAMALGVLLALMLDVVVRVLRVLLIERVAVVTEGDIDRALFANLLRKSGPMPPLAVVLDKYKQLLASRDFISSTYLLAATDLPFLLLFLVTIAVAAGPLVLIPILIGALAVAANLGATGVARTYDKLARKAGEMRVSLLTDLLLGREVVVTTDLRGDMSGRWRRASDAAAAASGRSRFWNGLAMAVASSSSSLAYAAVLVGGAYMVDEHLLTSGGLMASTMLTSRAMAMIASVVLLSTRMKEFRLAVSELDQVVPAAAPQDYAPRASDPSGEIRLADLTWRPRPDTRPVLDGLSLAVRPGEVVGIAGLPGAGKTTLLRLLAGAERPTEGQVLLDMVPVGRWDPRQLARSMGYKPQEAVLFEGTLEANILAGNRHASGEAVKAALERSGLRLAIERGELTLATELGPRGSFLSGGQRQMVALARALLGEPQILLLDEPSTGFDSQLERALAEYVASLAGKRTVILSSHSRALLSACTRIIVLQNGKVVADGPRERVLAA